MSNEISSDRLSVNLEWKRKAEEVRQQHPDSLLISLVGAHHTAPYLQKERPELVPLAYDKLVDGACFDTTVKGVAEGRHSIFSPDQGTRLYHQLSSSLSLTVPTPCTERRCCPLISNFFFCQGFEQARLLVNLMSNFYFRDGTTEAEDSKKEIFKFIENPASFHKDKGLSLGRVPVHVADKLCTALGIQNEERIYGQSSLANCINLQLKPAGLNKLLTMPESSLTELLLSIMQDMTEFKEARAAATQNRPGS